MDPSVTAPLTVSQHYDRLDLWYRSLWGRHLHHGLWYPETRDQTEASANLLKVIAGIAELRPGMSVCDVGCGYGGPACWLAERENVTVLGMTNSTQQVAQAERHSQVEIRFGEWLENGLPDQSFDTVVAIESLAHFQKPDDAIREMLRVVKPEGNVVVASWIAGPNVGKWTRRWLLNPICRTGYLPGLADVATLRDWVAASHGRLGEIRHFGREVRHSWWCSLKRAVRLLLSDRALAWDAFRYPFRSSRLGIDAVRIWISYRLGVLDYVILSAGPKGR